MVLICSLTKGVRLLVLHRSRVFRVFCSLCKWVGHLPNIPDSESVSPLLQLDSDLPVWQEKLLLSPSSPSSFRNIFPPLCLSLLYINFRISLSNSSETVGIHTGIETVDLNLESPIHKGVLRLLSRVSYPVCLSICTSFSTSYIGFINAFMQVLHISHEIYPQVPYTSYCHFKCNLMCVF